MTMPTWWQSIGSTESMSRWDWMMLLTQFKQHQMQIFSASLPFRNPPLLLPTPPPPLLQEHSHCQAHQLPLQGKKDSPLPNPMFPHRPGFKDLKRVSREGQQGLNCVLKLFQF